MNLINKLPHSIIIDSLEVSINTNFKASIQFEGLLKEDLTDEEFRIKALKIYYPIIPQNVNEAIKAIVWFYRCGEEPKEGKEQATGKDNIYSFEYDADYIYSAFLDQYGIDLQECDLHWWKFKSMFKSLKADNEISRIMSIRATDTVGLKGKELEYYKKLKKIYAIPKDEKEVNHSNSIAEILKRGGDLSELED